ncbi:hypothetical protein [Streptomyces sp. NPDC057418]|uniref:hypothetical protein n=1 Tax=Streptomyces sp. NPDC057418 TaxID=3346126 RepID=UPI0036961A86
MKNAELPWKKTVRVPLGTPPVVDITLGEKGGEAGCTLAISGKRVQRATASGAFGRSTCTTGEPPTPEASASP